MFANLSDAVLRGPFRVYGVEAGSTAERADLRVRDLVVAVDGEPAEGLDPDAVVTTDAVTFEVLRDDVALELHLGP